MAIGWYMMLSERLKEETQSLHDVLEQNPFMQKMENRSFNHKDYEALLSLFYGLHHMAEGQLSEYEELNMPLRERTSRIEQDLKELGCSEVAIQKSCDTDLELKIDTLSKAYGALYVLEGSRMGGMFLTKMIRSQLGEAIPVSYFEGFKEKTPAYVHEFKEFLNAKEIIINVKECIQCAKDMFVFVNYLFTRSANLS